MVSLVSCIWLVVGLVLVVFGADYLVEGASAVARRFGLSEFVIGLTIVGMGTSAPEMVVSFIGAAQGNADIALGNVVGSNIFNVFFILGTSAVVHPLPAYQGIELDAWAAAAGSLLVWLFVKSNHERQIKRWEGGFLLVVYAVYLGYRLLNV